LPPTSSPLSLEHRFDDSRHSQNVHAAGSTSADLLPHGGRQMTTYLTTDDIAARDATTSTSGRPPVPSTGLLDMIRADATAADARADFGAPTFGRMLDEGLFHILVPPAFGGAGGTPRQWFDATLTVAHADASAGWILAQGAVQNAWLAVAADERFAQEYFATRKTIATSGAGRVAAELLDGQYVMHDARWAYVSGSTHADYVGGMVFTTEPDGSIETRVVLQPVAAATIHPTWDTLGLRATASNDVDFGDRAEVPAWRTYTWPGLTVTRPGALANATTVAALISFSAAAVLLGVARRAIDVALESAEQKRRPLDKTAVAEQAPFIRDFAGMHGRVELATAGMRHLLDELWSRAVAGEAPDTIGRARLRLAAADAIATGVDVVRTAVTLVGADATHRSHPLERLTRDSQMLSHHTTVNAPSRERLGRVLLGTYDGPPGPI
jgi:alkylation response protein AidB-like acyl-CoA dehydrogenase